MRTLRRLLIAPVYALCLMAQDPAFVYTNNNVTPNSVSAFSVGANGALSPISGSPFLTAGNSDPTINLISTNRITTTTTKNFLYVGNSGSNNVSAFSINTLTGVLAAVPGSPFATGGLSVGGGGISLAVTPDDQFLIATNNASGNITVFSIAVNGSLAPVPGSPFPVGAGGLMDGIKVTPDGKFLAVARSVGTLGPGPVSVFGITASGGLVPVSGSPFATSANAGGVDCNCASTHLYVASGTGFSPTAFELDAFNIGANGALSPISGSPFVGPGAEDQVVILSPDDSKLFASNSASADVTVFSIGSDGVPTVVSGSPFPAGALFPSGMASNAAGTFLYVADVNTQNISAFSIAANGALIPVPGQPFGATIPSGSILSSLTVFPPKNCCPAPVLSGASATPDALWPPDHTFVEVTIGYEVTGPCPNTCVLTVASNEPANAGGDGNTSPDWKVVDAHHVLLSAERSGEGAGRIYTVTITCTNNLNGLPSTKTVTVLVPHDQAN
jgi:6-phosphogluconolactonase